MSQIPKDKAFDNTMALLSEGYKFISNKCLQLKSDVFITRIMLRKVTCLMGEEATREFYANERLTRKGAIPLTALKLLQDNGSALELDGEAHRWRKSMLMSLMNKAGIDRLCDLTAEHWENALAKWQSLAEIILLHEIQEVLCRAVCEWTGIPLQEDEVKARTAEFAAMIDGAGSFGLRNIKGHFLRAKTESWIENLIKQIRSGGLKPTAGSAAHTIALHRDLHGNLLSTQIAVVELINILRPTVAVAHYIMFAALALHQYPHCREKIFNYSEDYLSYFVHEVRRFYPFFPFVGGHVQKEFEWREHLFKKGDWLLLDLYGTNHDERLWNDANTFEPERFRNWNGNAFSLIPQGGGDIYTTHRCAGEWLTIALMKKCILILTKTMHYSVPEQDLSIDLRRFPAQPASQLRIIQIKAISK